MNTLPTIWTIGHSTRSWLEFLELLNSASITLVGDVRRFPASRRYPHFNQSIMRDFLAADNIQYLSLPDLGGRRQERPNAPKTVWRNSAFRAYADYMQTAAFQHGIQQVMTIIQTERLALLCSEAVWWRCHRSLIADYLKAKGYPVIHILSPTRHDLHPYTSAARLVDGQLSYLPPADSVLSLALE